MLAKKQLPRGMRNNNPGNLRNAVGGRYRPKYDNDYAIADNIVDGLEWFFRLCDNYYSIHDRTTLTEFIPIFAPASENDVSLYINRMVSYLNFDKKNGAQVDLKLDHAWRAIAFANAVFRIENGTVPLQWPSWPEWVSPTQMILAMARTGKWDTL